MAAGCPRAGSAERGVRRPQHLRSLVQLRGRELPVEAVTLDVTDRGSVAAAERHIEQRFGRMDVLVNNARVSGGGQQPGSADLDTVSDVFATNVVGVVAVTEAMLPLLRRSSAPRIVNLSTFVGSLAAMSDPESPIAALPASVAYVPSKTALNALTVQYARALRSDGVLVNAADPGYCATDLNGHTGYQPAAQGAAIAVRLASLGTDGPTGGFFNDEGPAPW